MEFHNTTQIFCLFVISILVSVCAYAEEPPVSESANQTNTLWLAPPTEFYPQYIADPRRAQFALVLTTHTDRKVPATTKARSSIRFGERLSLARFHPDDNTDAGWQIDLEAGFFSQFSLEGGWDNYAWDGVQGLLVSYKPVPHLGFRFGFLHDSAHLGDEYMEETGRERINYTREEIVAGFSWQPNQQWHLYSEISTEYEPKGVAKGNRFQIGTEYFGSKKIWQGRLTPYTAIDANFFSERDWVSATTAQIGLMMPTRLGSSRYRVAFEFFSGRSAMSEFSFYDETYIGFGLYFDI